ncbi:MAG: prepilin-type N-terminal cleavage/methylation domain-containing protein [Candidatus Magasanikbacteria bacterium]|nr:prepilin-type N-terminal cleavage/methylation domain-containing protein [Candidatus Magasanikbacteria bacterium]
MFCVPPKEKKNKNKGFTLIELLIVITIISIIVVVIFSLLNPLELFAHSRNAQRWVKVSEFLNAIHVYTVKHDGRVPNPSTWQENVVYVLGTDNSGCDIACGNKITTSTCLYLSDLIDDKKVPRMPVDPKGGTTGNTDFYIVRESGSVVTMGVCDPELGEVIELTR